MLDGQRVQALAVEVLPELEQVGPVRVEGVAGEAALELQVRRGSRARALRSRPAGRSREPCEGVRPAPRPSWPVQAAVQAATPAQVRSPRSPAGVTRTIRPASPRSIQLALEALRGDGRAQAAGQVVAGLGPVLARPGERAAAAAQRRHVDAELADRRLAVGGEREAPVGGLQRAAADERVGQVDAEHAGQVVVAEAGLAQVLLAVGVAQRAHLRGRGELGERLERVGHRRPGQPVQAPPPRGLDGDQPAVGELAQVRAGQRARGAGRVGQRRGRLGAAAEQGQEHLGPLRVGEQRADAGEVCISGHGRTVPPEQFNVR